MELLSSVYGVVLMIVGFGALIFVHELGHFIAAKWAGIRTQAFAVGMGPVLLSWRLGTGFAVGSSERAVVEKTGKPSSELSDEDLAEHGIGETEYSLRALPIGGFVKMLGQEDANPNAVSMDPRSYMMRPIGKRMVVVSAGVVMNVILAILLFVAAFLAGVRFEAPVIGDVTSTAPAGVAIAHNAAALGIDAPGLQAGDTVLAIDGKPARTFADVQIATAMAKPGRVLEFQVERPGLTEPLEFSLKPTPGLDTGLLSIGVNPGRSNQIWSGKPAANIPSYLESVGLTEVQPGMRLTSAGQVTIGAFSDLASVLDGSSGAPVPTVWTTADGDTKNVLLPVRPVYQSLWQTAGDLPVRDVGLLGFNPLVKIEDVLDDSPNQGVVHPGDVVLAIEGIDFPRSSELRREIRRRPGETLTMRVERDGAPVETEVTVSRRGAIGVVLAPAASMPITANPIASVLASPATPGNVMGTPAGTLRLLGGTRIDAVEGRTVADWPAFREALCDATASARSAQSGVSLQLTVINPTPGRERETLTLQLGAEDVAALHELGWTSALSGDLFEPIYTTLSAGGDPIRAAAMGFGETHKMIVMTYLTIDRLFRRSVGVEQLRGPVGIIDLGTKIINRGFWWFIFFLAMISVNLAVINFLPIPIVDGGLFLFLIYEKIKGRPPSIQFQNVATIVGLCLIGTVFLVTFYNDIMRLVGT